MACLVVSAPVWAEEGGKALCAIDFLTGFGQADLIQKKDYRLMPFIIGFDFDMKPLTKKIGFNPPSMVHFQIEPFLALATSPDTNVEVGTSFLFKFGLLPESSKIQPYIKGGSGMLYMSQHTLEQSTQFNFISHAGLGFHWFFEPERALTVEYRFRHLSNASIKHPNSGIDSHYAILGITHRF